MPDATPPSSRPVAARAPTCARSPATWAALLGCLGHVIALRRTRVGRFSEAEAVTLTTLQEAARSRRGRLAALLLPVEAALHELPALDVGQNDAARLLRGQSVLIRGRDAPMGGAPPMQPARGT